ncbi:MAG: hypothetical protein U0270_21395 [Labilithrix sp.]
MPAPDARARAIVARLSEGNASSDEVFAAFEELDHLPPDVVRGALEPWTGPAPDPERLDDQVRRAHRLPLRTPRLTTIDSARDADVLDLGDLAESQLRIAGKTWDGQDLEAFDRLDGEREDSFAGTLERRVLGENGRPLYDVLLFGEGSGVFFRSGTTQVLGVIADHCVETTDRPARLALEQALGRDAAPAPAPAPVERVTDRAAQKQLALPIDVAPPPAPPAHASVETTAQVDEEAEADAEAELEAAPAPKKKATKKTAAKKKTAAPKKKAAAAAPKKKKAAATTKKKKASAASDDA